MPDFHLADLLAYTKDGEWGQGTPGDDTVAMLVIRGTDFADVRQGDLSNVPIRHIPAHIAERKRLEPGDIIIETAGGTKDQPTGRTVLLKESLFAVAKLPITCASFSRFLRVNRDLAYPDYLFWYLQYLYRTGETYPFHVQHTGVARFQYTQFANHVIFSLPSIEAQEAVATLLNALDDKIELNRHLNQTLEEMATAIFKDWFVDFGPIHANSEGRSPYLAPSLWSLFPKRLGDNDLPVGWSLEKLGKATTVSIGRTPSRARQECFTKPPSGITWLSIRDLGNSGLYALNSSENLTEKAVNEFRVPEIPADTVIVSFKLTVGRVAITDAPMTSNEAIAHLVINDGMLVSNKYLYCYMKAFDYGSLASTSSIATAVNSDSIRQIDILIPESAVQNGFDTIVAPLFEKIRFNIHQSNTLAQLRDLLLPKLISGEIRLNDGEDTLGGAL